MDNVQALKNLYEQLGGDPADVANISTNADTINAIAGLDIGGGGDVDQTYDATSENAQSGTAVAEALETIPSVTVDQTFDATSANAQSGTAVAQAVQNSMKYIAAFTVSGDNVIDDSLQLGTTGKGTALYQHYMVVLVDTENIPNFTSKDDYIVFVDGVPMEVDAAVSTQQRLYITNAMVNSSASTSSVTVMIFKYK